MECLGCDAYHSTVYDGFESGRACPFCGLPSAATEAVLAARKRKADEELVAKYLEAEKRAGTLATENRTLRYRLDGVERALKAEAPVSPW